jgi:Rrf2 family protein
MIRLNRTTEYGLMAMRLMSQKCKQGSQFTSAREVADEFGLPFEITAKTLQRMKETGLIQSTQGARGGYILSRKLEEITLAEFLELMEGPQSVVACHNHSPLKPAKPVKAGGTETPVSAKNCACEYEKKCQIQGLMLGLNAKVKSFLGGIRLADLSDSDLRMSKLSDSLQTASLAEEP